MDSTMKIKPVGYIGLGAIMLTSNPELEKNKE